MAVITPGAPLVSLRTSSACDLWRRALIVLFCVSASASAAPPKSSDSFSGYRGLQFRSPIAKNKGFEKHWLIAPGDDDKTAIHYVSTGDVLPFQGIKIDKAVLVVSKRMRVVVGFAFTLSGDRCAAMEKALDSVWGKSEEIGGIRHEIGWLGDRVDASLERDGPDGCMLFIGDRAWDDETDEYKKRHL